MQNDPDSVRMRMTACEQYAIILFQKSKVVSAYAQKKSPEGYQPLNNTRNGIWRVE